MEVEQWMKIETGIKVEEWRKGEHGKKVEQRIKLNSKG